MSLYINRSSDNNNHFLIKEYIDKEKIISKIFKNIESKAKIIEKYKNKYYNSNNLLDSIILGKLEFLEILNDFEEIISQSLQCMRTLFAEIRNLKEKKKLDDNLKNKRNNKLKNISLNIDKSYSAYLDKCANIKDENEKNKSQIDPKETIDINIYRYKYYNKNKKNNCTKLYYKKNPLYIKKYNNSMINNKYNENISKATTRNTMNEIKNGTKSNKNISIDSMGNKDIMTYDLSIINNLGKENENPNQSSLMINNEYNSFNKIQNNQNNRKILRLELKNKDINENTINSHINKNNSICQRYELELENTEKEKTEKIEVDIKFPIRQGIRRNCRKRSVQLESSKSELLDRFNYNSNKNEIIEKIKKDIKIKNYFAKKYGENKFENFLNKIWKNKLNLNEINRELNILIKTKQTEEKYKKIHDKQKENINSNNININNNGKKFLI